MSTRTVPDFEDEPPTAVRNMREVLRVYEKNAKRGLKKLNDTWRKKTSSSPHAPPSEDVAAESAEPVEPPEKEAPPEKGA